MRNKEFYYMFCKINDKIDVLNKKVESLLKLHSVQDIKISSNDILRLPKHLQETYLALNTIGRGTALDVARITGKARSVESKNLNELTRLGKIKKIRLSRTRIFELKQHEESVRLNEVGGK